MAEAATLAGEWVRTVAPACAVAYPARLRFGADGQYRGEAAPPGEFTLWDVGTWRVTAPDLLAISTANDAVVSYRFTLASGVLEFLDPAGCRFAYRRP